MDTSAGTEPDTALDTAPDAESGTQDASRSADRSRGEATHRAIVRLHAEGHVQRHPGGGFEPTFPDMDRIAQLYEVRKSLELNAVRRRVGDGPETVTHDRSALLELRRDSVALDQRAAP